MSTGFTSLIIDAMVIRFYWTTFLKKTYCNIVTIYSNVVVIVDLAWFQKLEGFGIILVSRGLFYTFKCNIVPSCIFVSYHEQNNPLGNYK